MEVNASEFAKGLVRLATWELRPPVNLVHVRHFGGSSDAHGCFDSGATI